MKNDKLRNRRIDKPISQQLAVKQPETNQTKRTFNLNAFLLITRQSIYASRKGYFLSLPFVKFKMLENAEFI